MYRGSTVGTLPSLSTGSVTVAVQVQYIDGTYVLCSSTTGMYYRTVVRYYRYRSTIPGTEERDRESYVDVVLVLYKRTQKTKFPIGRHRKDTPPERQRVVLLFAVGVRTLHA